MLWDMPQAQLKGSTNMKLYIVYDPQGYDRGYVRAYNHNSAEVKAIQLYGAGSSVAYTEI